MARKKTPSRADRWASAIDEAKEAASELEQKLADLEEIRQEYVEWLENIGDKFEGTAMREKLENVCENIDIQSHIDAVGEITQGLEEAEGADLPLGFGRD